jgi:Domain of unknown function (DUF4345)
MTKFKRVILYGLLGLLGADLLISGLFGVFAPGTGDTRLVAQSVEARNQLRAFYGMMAALGAVALRSCFDLVRFRHVIGALGVIMALVAVARTYSLVADGRPGGMFFLYLAVEALMSVIFLTWAPRSSRPGAP